MAPEIEAKKIGQDGGDDEATDIDWRPPDVSTKALEQIASGEQSLASTPTAGGGGKNIAAFFEFGKKDAPSAATAKGIEAFGADVPLPAMDAVTGTVGTFSAAKIASLQTPTIVRSIPWNLERPMALRNANPTALARTLAEPKGDQSTFATVAESILDQTSTVKTSAMNLTKVDAAPKKKASESDYYDTLRFSCSTATTPWPPGQRRGSMPTASRPMLNSRCWAPRHSTPMASK